MDRRARLSAPCVPHGAPIIAAAHATAGLRRAGRLTDARLSLGLPRDDGGRHAGRASGRGSRAGRVAVLPPPGPGDVRALRPLRPADLLALRDAGPGWLPVPRVRPPGARPAHVDAPVTAG